MKKILSIALTVTLIFALTACGGGSGSSAPSSMPPTSQQDSSAEPVVSSNEGTDAEVEFVMPTDAEIRAISSEMPWELMGNGSEAHALGSVGHVDALVTYVDYHEYTSMASNVWLYSSFPVAGGGYETRFSVVDEDEVSPDAWLTILNLQPDQGVRMYFVLAPSDYSADGYFTLKCVDEIESTFTNADVRADYEAQCPVVPYKDILRSPSDFEKTRMAVTLKISQTMDGGFRCYAVDASGRQLMDEEWYLVDTRHSDEPKLLETDVVQVYGTFIELVGITRALTGATDEIPKIQGTYIDIIG